MKTKIAIDLPTREKLLAGLTPREVHPPLARAESTTAEAEQALRRRREELAACERTVAELPARIQRGEVKASALTDALRSRDAAALLIPPAEAALNKARERLPLEQKAADLAVGREVMRRAEQLERLASELAPVLNELRDLSLALSRVPPCGHPQALGMSAVEWPCDLNCDIGHHMMATSSAK